MLNAYVFMCALTLAMRKVLKNFEVKFGKVTGLGSNFE